MNEKNDVISKTREMISSMGGSETKAIVDNKSLQKLFQQKQLLLVEMNKAKKEAAELAAIPFLESIKELDEKYSFMLTFLGNNNKDTN